MLINMHLEPKEILYHRLHYDIMVKSNQDTSHVATTSKPPSGRLGSVFYKTYYFCYTWQKLEYLYYKALVLMLCNIMISYKADAIQHLRICYISIYKVYCNIYYEPCHITWNYDCITVIGCVALNAFFLIFMYNVQLANFSCYISIISCLFCYIQCYIVVSIYYIAYYIMLNITYCVSVTQGYIVML